MYYYTILICSTTIKSFFDRQEVINQTKTMKERSRERESSLNISLNKDDADIFEEGIKYPRWAGILHSCLQNLEEKVNEILSFVPQRKKPRLNALGTWRKLMNP